MIFLFTFICFTLFICRGFALNDEIISNSHDHRELSTSLTVNCPTYVTKNTESASKNYVDCKFSFCGGNYLSVPCAVSGYCVGDNLIRLYDMTGSSTGTEMAVNDDFCFYCSALFVPLIGDNKCHNYTLRQGCWQNEGCAAQYTVFINTFQPGENVSPSELSALISMYQSWKDSPNGAEIFS
eukprot:gene17233-23758_t